MIIQLRWVLALLVIILLVCWHVSIFPVRHKKTSWSQNRRKGACKRRVREVSWRELRTQSHLANQMPEADLNSSTHTTTTRNRSRLTLSSSADMANSIICVAQQPDQQDETHSSSGDDFDLPERPLSLRLLLLLTDDNYSDCVSPQHKCHIGQFQRIVHLSSISIIRDQFIAVSF